MKKTLFTSAVLLVFFFLAIGTVSAQEKRIERKVHVVTIEDGKKTVIDTTYVVTDTTDINFDKFIGEFDDEDTIFGIDDDRKMFFTDRLPDMPEISDFPPMPDFPDSLLRQYMRNMISILEENGEVTYDITIDGVNVHIDAPEEKAKEAEEILAKVKEILSTK